MTPSPTNTTIFLRPAIRSDLPTLSHISNDANSNSAIHDRIAPTRDKHPVNFYLWRLNLLRSRLVTAGLRNIAAVERSESEDGEKLLGLATWAVEGADTALYREWHSTATWFDWLETKAAALDKWYARYIVGNPAIDHIFLDKFFAIFSSSVQATRPPCLHLHSIFVDPSTQGKGVGKSLVDWGKDVAVRAELPVYLESNLEVTGFYERAGFRRLGGDVVIREGEGEEFRIPCYVWEGTGEGREGRWLERDESWDGEGERWRWRVVVLGEDEDREKEEVKETVN